MTKKQKIKFIALLTTTASLAVGSYFFKKKVEKMKEDGTFNTMVFKKRLNQYLKAAKKDELTLEIIDGLLAELDKMNDFKATHEGFELNLDTDKYMELQDYLDAYYSRLASSNHFKQADTNEDNTQVRLRKCLNTQKYILESSKVTICRQNYSHIEGGVPYGTKRRKYLQKERRQMGRKLY